MTRNKFINKDNSKPKFTVLPASERPDVRAAELLQFCPDCGTRPPAAASSAGLLAGSSAQPSPVQQIFGDNVGNKSESVTKVNHGISEFIKITLLYLSLSL